MVLKKPAGISAGCRYSRSSGVLLFSTPMPALGPKLLARLTVQAFRVGLIRAGFGHRLFFGRHRFGEFAGAVEVCPSASLPSSASDRIATDIIALIISIFLFESVQT